MNTNAATTEDIAENQGFGCGCLVVPGLFTLALAAFMLALFYFLDVRHKQRFHQTDETRYDPLAVEGEIRDFAAWGIEEYADTLELQSVDIDYVRADGTLDLTADYEPTVNWRWVGPRLDPSGPPGVGSEDVYLTVRVEATDRHTESTGTGESTSQSFYLGLRRYEYESEIEELRAVPWPKCSLTELWDHALQAGAPDDGVAQIRYDHRGYDFEIEGVDIEIEFDHDCEPRT